MNKNEYSAILVEHYPIHCKSLCPNCGKGFEGCLQTNLKIVCPYCEDYVDPQCESVGQRWIKFDEKRYRLMDKRLIDGIKTMESMIIEKKKELTKYKCRFCGKNYTEDNPPELCICETPVCPDCLSYDVEGECLCPNCLTELEKEATERAI